MRGTAFFSTQFESLFLFFCCCSMAFYFQIFHDKTAVEKPKQKKNRLTIRQVINDRIIDLEK